MLETTNSPVADATITEQVSEDSTLAGGNSQDSVTDGNTEAVVEATDSVEGDTDNDNDDTEIETEKKSKKGFEKRIERFNKKLATKDAELEYWRNAAMGVKTPETQTQVQPTADKPKFADFNDLETYTEAVTDWKLNNALRDMEAKQSAKSVATTYNQRVVEFAKSTPDFQDVVNDFQAEYGNSLPPEIIQAAMDSDVGPQMAYFLANNTDEVDRIAALAPHRRLIELGKIEDRLSNTGVKETRKPPKLSKAPAPITSEKGNAPVVKSIEDPNISQADYRALRMATKKRY